MRPEVEAELDARLQLANGTFKTAEARQLDDVTEVDALTREA